MKIVLLLYIEVDERYVDEIDDCCYGVLGGVVLWIVDGVVYDEYVGVEDSCNE